METARGSMYTVWKRTRVHATPQGPGVDGWPKSCAIKGDACCSQRATASRLDASVTLGTHRQQRRLVLKVLPQPRTAV